MTSDYFSAPAPRLPLLHTRSLSVEEQAYIDVAAVLSLLWGRIAPRWSLRSWSRYREALPIPRPWFEATTSMRSLSQHREREAVDRRRVALHCGASRCPGAVHGPVGHPGSGGNRRDSGRGSMEIRPFRGSLHCRCVSDRRAVIAASYASSGIVSRVLSLAPLQRLGKLSYSLYLWHWPILSLHPLRQ